MKELFSIKKSRIRETPTLSTDADIYIYIFIYALGIKLLHRLYLPWNQGGMCWYMLLLNYIAEYFIALQFLSSQPSSKTDPESSGLVCTAGLIDIIWGFMWN